MATQNNSMKTRIQLKRDTEANWNKAGPKENSSGFIPLQGELVVYLPDATHNYSRLKVGDGATNIIYLPFIDSGTVNGDIITNELVQFSGLFPQTGDSTKLYIKTDTQTLYYYNGTSFVKLSNFVYTTTKTTASHVLSWTAGSSTSITINGGRVTVSNGRIPELLYLNRDVVSNVAKEGSD